MIVPLRSPEQECLKDMVPRPWVVGDRNAEGTLTAQSGHRHKPDDKTTNPIRPAAWIIAGKHHR